MAGEAAVGQVDALAVGGVAFRGILRPRRQIKSADAERHHAGCQRQPGRRQQPKYSSHPVLLSAAR